MNPFSSLFGRSPIKPIKRQMKVVVECSEQLLPFFKSVYTEDWVQAETIQKKIADLEKRADIIKKEIRQNLPKGLFLPVPRSDLVNMLRIQDKIANISRDIAGIIYGRRICFPEVIKDSYEHLILKSLETTNQSLKAINELDELLETGFGSKEVNIVAEIINNLDNMEHDTDEIQIEIRNKLFQIEKDLPPVDVMFLYQVISWTGDLADQAQRVGGQLQLLIAN